MNILMIFIRTIMLYFIITLGTTYISYKINRKFEKSIAIYFCIAILTLYIFGLFEVLKYGVWGISILSILLGIYAIIKDKKNIKEKMFTSGFTFFSIAFFVLFFTSIQKGLVDYDHFFYRSLNTKNMYYHNTMSKGYLNLYTPTTTLLQYFFMKIIGTYLQGIESFAMQMFGFALLLPIFDRKKGNGFVNAIIAILIMCIPAVFTNVVFYESAYPDAVLGLMIGYCMYTLYIENNNYVKVLSTCLVLLAMSITKPIGFYIAGIVVLMYLIITLINIKKENKFRKFIKSTELKNIVIFIVLIIVLFTSWKVFTKINNKNNYGEARSEQIKTYNDGPIVKLIKTTMTTMFGYYEGPEHDESDTNAELINKIYTTYATKGIIRLTLYGATVALLISSIIAYKYIIKNENKKEYSKYIISLFVGLVLYILLLEMSYILKFGKGEMLTHAGMDRYMPTFLLGILYFIIATIIDSFENKKVQKINYIILVVTLISFTNIQSLANATITSGIYNIQSIEYTNIGRIQANEIAEAIGENDEIAIFNQDVKKDIFNYMIRYYLYPEHTSYSYNGISEKNINNLIKDISKNNIKYLYALQLEDDFNELSNNKLSLENKTLYKINIIDENTIELEKIKNCKI